MCQTVSSLGGTPHDCSAGKASFGTRNSGMVSSYWSEFKVILAYCVRDCKSTTQVVSSVVPLLFFSSYERGTEQVGEAGRGGIT